jgi:hypothetical protein
VRSLVLEFDLDVPRHFARPLPFSPLPNVSISVGPSVPLRKRSTQAGASCSRNRAQRKAASPMIRPGFL